MAPEALFVTTVTFLAITLAVAPSHYLLYTGVCPLSALLLLIYRFSLFAATLSCPIPLSPAGLSFQLDTLFLLFARGFALEKPARVSWRKIASKNLEKPPDSHRVFHPLLRINITARRIFVIAVGSTSSLMTCFYDNFFLNDNL